MTGKSDSEILQARAKALASARVASSSFIDTTHDRYLILVCGSDRFAIALESVMEVFRPATVTPLPRAVPPLWGLTSWRGSILPVVLIDKSVPAQGSGVVVIIATGTRVIAGLWANEVEAEVAITEAEIHEAPPSGGVRELIVSGVTSDAKSVVDAVRLAQLLDERSVASDRAVPNNNSGIKV